MTILVDTDVLIDVSRGARTEALSRWNEFSESDSLILYSAVSAAELWAGVRPKEQESLQLLLGALSCVPATSDIGRMAGQFLQRYRKSHGLELADSLIAASAVASGAALWTCNCKHYPMPELVLA